jgi:hypothetical protein
VCVCVCLNRSLTPISSDLVKQVLKITNEAEYPPPHDMYPPPLYIYPIYTCIGAKDHKRRRVGCDLRYGRYGVANVLLMCC